MARTRFVGDAGLTVRMTTVMFLLGGLFVALVVALMAIAGGYGGMGFALIVGFIGIGIAIYQWWSSDTVAMKAMRAREVTPQQAPELHAMIDRLCVLADMPKPRVGVADTSMPNAFATGRSPDRSVVVVTTGILQLLTVEELEGVLAHELAHVAHRDVLVMTVASSAGIVAGMVTQGAQYGAMFGGHRREGNSALPVWLLMLLDARGIECSTGSACSAGVPQASHVLLAMGRDDDGARSSLRFPLGRTSVESDVDAVVEAIAPAVERARAAKL